MKLKIQTELSSEHGSLRPGDIIEIPIATAQAWIEAGLATRFGREPLEPDSALDDMILPDDADGTSSPAAPAPARVNPLKALGRRRRR